VTAEIFFKMTILSLEQEIQIGIPAAVLEEAVSSPRSVSRLLY